VVYGLIQWRFNGDSMVICPLVITHGLLEDQQVQLTMHDFPILMHDFPEMPYHLEMFHYACFSHFNHIQCTFLVDFPCLCRIGELLIPLESRIPNPRQNRKSKNPMEMKSWWLIVANNDG
jgi:hypothetical protein